MAEPFVLQRGLPAGLERQLRPIMSEKQTALVSGGGTGIGQACCRALAAAGLRVIVHYNSSQEAASRLAGELPEAFTVRADLGDPDQVEAMVAEIKEKAGRLDVLVNNAGFSRDGLIPRMKIQDYDAVAAIERGTWFLTRLVLRHFMLRANSGRIINISSVVAYTGNAGQIPYAMAKAGIDAMTRSLAHELSGRKILVNSVAPGFIDTAMTQGMSDQVRQGILERVPLGRMGEPAEVAEVVTFLATSAGYIHGSIVHVNGGLYGG